jgi:hypothetical protein
MNLWADRWRARGSNRDFCQRLSFANWERLADLERAVVLLTGLERVGRRAVALYRPDLTVFAAAELEKARAHARAHGLALVPVKVTPLPKGKTLLQVETPNPAV